MTDRRYFPKTHDPILTEMNQKWRRTDREIADEMGFDLCTITPNRKRLGLPTNPRPRPMQHRTEPNAIPAPPDRLNPVAMAIHILGARVTERNGCYVLDGRRPISAPDMVREANRVRLRMELEQFGPVGWRV
jgi:hypothetical protein